MSKAPALRSALAGRDGMLTSAPLYAGATCGGGLLLGLAALLLFCPIASAVLLTSLGEKGTAGGYRA